MRARFTFEPQCESGGRVCSQGAGVFENPPRTFAVMLFNYPAGWGRKDILTTRASYSRGRVHEFFRSIEQVCLSSHHQQQIAY